MKTKVFMLGLWVAVFGLSSCNDEKEVTVTDITVSPSEIPAMEVGETIELTAAITPDHATEDLRWEVYDNTIVSIESQGRKAILKAVGSGTTRVFATNKTGIVVSEELTVKVNSSEYAKFVVGSYLGTANVKGALTADLSGVQVKMERIAGENAQVKLTLVAVLPNMGELTIASESVTVSPVSGEPETYAFKGRTLPLEFLSNATLEISGKYSATGKALTLDLTTDILSIHVDAAPGTPTDYAALVAGDYVGSAQSTGMTIDFSNLQAKLTRTDANKVSLAVTAEASGFGLLSISGEMTVAAGSQPETCTFNGLAKLADPMEMDLDVTGSYNTLTHTLTLTLAATNGLITIHIEAVPPDFDPSNYAAQVEGNYLGSAKLTSPITEDLNDVKIALERVDNGTVKITLTANVSLLGEVTVTGDAIAVTEGAEANTYALNGTATASLGNFSVTGTVDVTGKTLEVKLAGGATIEVTAEKVEEEPPAPSVSYAEIVAGDYTGEATLTGGMNATLPNTPVRLELIAGETDAVKFTIEANVSGMGALSIVSEALTVAPGETADTYTLNGEALLAALGNLPLVVTGTYDASDRTVDLHLEASIVTIAYSGSRLSVAE
ncbi:MAG: hypothetical protein LBP98_09175 [Tannerella sp.]|jgi:hypothetical protein|nr:hypothetical protein [Tannerella sp.]